MLLYTITNEGDLIQLKKFEFLEDEVYIAVDENTIYVWFGRNLDEKKRMIAIKTVRKLNNESEGSSKLLLMDQDREYGSFLAMMDNLKEGLGENHKFERRPELIIETPQKITEQAELDKVDLENQIKNWLTQLKNYRQMELEKKITEPEEEEDLESQIKVAAYFLSLKNLSYNDLCWILAEKELLIQQEIVSEQDIKKKAEEIFRSSSTYDELCWLIAELDILVEKNYFDIT